MDDFKQNSKENRSIGSKIEETPAKVKQIKPITPNTKKMKDIIAILRLSGLSLITM